MTILILSIEGKPWKHEQAYRNTNYVLALVPLLFFIFFRAKDQTQGLAHASQEL
jgi:hypothetical protein